MIYRLIAVDLQRRPSSNCHCRRRRVSCGVVTAEVCTGHIGDLLELAGWKREDEGKVLELGFRSCLFFGH